MTPETERAPARTSDPQPSTANRRAFLAGLGLGGAGVGALVASTAMGWPREQHTEHSDGMSDMTPSGADATGLTDDEMNEHHLEMMQQFLANIEAPITEGVGAQEAESTMDGDVRVFELVCAETEWQITPDITESALTYNGMVPGPTIRCTEGETIRIHVTNDMTQSTSVHWHGQRVPNDQDGVTFITQDPILPGETFTYEFVARPSGTHMYHSHHNSTEQVGRGLLGALIVEPADRAGEPAYDREELVILNDALGGFTINGKGFPATTAYAAQLGERIRFRFMNEGLAIHPMHLHGLVFEVFARDGWPLPQPFKCDTLNIAPGERWDAIVECDALGVWAFHCHILSHAEGPMGMFGMVTALAVTDPNAEPAETSDTTATTATTDTTDTTDTTGTTATSGTTDTTTETVTSDSEADDE